MVFRHNKVEILKMKYTVQGHTACGGRAGIGIQADSRTLFPELPQPRRCPGSLPPLSEPLFLCQPLGRMLYLSWCQRADSWGMVGKEESLPSAGLAMTPGDNSFPGLVGAQGN